MNDMRKIRHIYILVHVYIYICIRKVYDELNVASLKYSSHRNVYLL